MVSRRNFLTTTSAVGMLAMTTHARCSPAQGAALSKAADVSYQGGAAEFVRQREQFLTTDPKIFLGYPGNKNMPPEGYFKWRDELFRLELGDRVYNNVGDPYRNRGVYNSHYLEAEIADRFGARFGFDPTDTWGFVSNSGTDSNMHGAYIGRTLLKQKTGQTPKIYYTKEAHYSIQIIRDLLTMDEVLVGTNPDGSMNIDDLKDKLKAGSDAPVLLLATIGTTFKGSIDDIDDIQQALKGYESYVHLDAALFGGYLQASKFASDLYSVGPSGKRYDSISISCHKFFGFPTVAGVFITNKSTFEEYREYFSKVHDPAYISHVPGTITCSRDPLKPALFHYFSTDQSFKQQSLEADAILADTGYLYKEMQSHFPELNTKRANDRSNTLYFKPVNSKIKKKWSLATIGRDASEALAHVVLMPHATRPYLDLFLEDLEKYKA
ncbi:MAG: histidine decarboxylase [Candidatus Azotimanducaceae bacterium]|jgi:histidine decarboxylase